MIFKIMMICHNLKTYFGGKKENGDQLIFNFTLSTGSELQTRQTQDLQQKVRI